MSIWLILLISIVVVAVALVAILLGVIQLQFHRFNRPPKRTALR